MHAYKRYRHSNNLLKYESVVRNIRIALLRLEKGVLKYESVVRNIRIALLRLQKGVLKYESVVGTNVLHC